MKTFKDTALRLAISLSLVLFIAACSTEQGSDSEGTSAPPTEPEAAIPAEDNPEERMAMALL